jgi:FkbM family methyltransferase
MSQPPWATSRWERYGAALRGLRLVRNPLQVLLHMSGFRKGSIEYRLRNGQTLWLDGSPASRTAILSVQEIVGDESYPLDEPGIETVLDVGANVGLFSLWAADRDPRRRIWAYEPNPRNLEALRRNVDCNGLSDRVTICPQAVSGGGAPSVDLYINRYNSRAHSTLRAMLDASFESAKLADREIEAVSVKAVSLSEALDQAGLERCDLLKMDIEGGEYSVLYETASQDFERIDRIFLECHELSRIDPGYTRVDLVCFLRSVGYLRVVSHREYVRAWRS